MDRMRDSVESRFPDHSGTADAGAASSSARSVQHKRGGVAYRGIAALAALLRGGSTASPRRPESLTTARTRSHGFTKVIATLAAAVLLTGAALLTGHDTAEAGRGGQSCITTYNGKWALVEIGLNATCTGQNDRGSVLAISDIPAEQAKPAVLPGWDGRMPTYRFFYQEDNLRNVGPTTATRLSPANQDLRVDETRSVPKVGPLSWSDSVNFVGPIGPRETLRVVYRADEHNRTVEQGGRYYREWRDNRGVWLRSGSYGSDNSARDLASWNTHQRSVGSSLFDADDLAQLPPGEDIDRLRTAHKLTGNSDQTDASPSAFHNIHDRDQAQAFTTGVFPGGFTLTRVDLDLIVGGPGAPIFTVSLYSDDNGQPGTSLGSLTAPTSLIDGLNEFTASGNGIVLDPDTTYWVVIDTSTPGDSGDTPWRIRSTESDDEDVVSNPGWGVSDVSRHRSWDSPWWSPGGQSREIDIHGYLN